MVKAILEGRKTQIRRVIRIQPPEPDGYKIITLLDTTDRNNRKNIGKLSWSTEDEKISENIIYFKQPYKIGDKILVKETFQLSEYYKDMPIPNQKIVINYLGKKYNINYKADDYCANFEEFNSQRWISSLFMPRWASRITLEITNVKVERLQKITYAGIIKEGYIENSKFDFKTNAGLAKKWFHKLWDSINGKKYHWESNPWVFVISFKRI